MRLTTSISEFSGVTEREETGTRLAEKWVSGACRGFSLLVCMYACMYVYIYIGMYVCIYVCMYVYMYIYIGI
jgi:hypothetical protein